MRQFSLCTQTALLRFFIACLAVSGLLLGQVAVTTQHNDLDRTGANLNETILNTSNVSVNTFGKLFSREVDGQIYAQPLYVPNLLIPGQGVHNVVYICTEHNSVYAFDADLPGASNPLWQVNLGPSLPASVIGGTDNLLPEIGITSTPVIDLSSDTIYVVAETYVSGKVSFNLHALNFLTGAEKFNGPVVISGSVSTNSGNLAFSAITHWQRPGLLLWNGNIYIAFGSHYDSGGYHGWIFGYSAATLQQTAIRCLTPNGAEGGVWQGGAGLAVDANGFMYLQSGNGSMDANTGGSDYGDSAVKLDTNNGLAVVDYFAPSNELALESKDADMGAAGPLLIPGTSLGIGGGKDGKLFLWNTNNLGQFNATTDQVVQEWQATYSLVSTGDGGFFGGNVFYNNTLYVWGRRDFLKAYAFNGSTFNTTPTEDPFTLPDEYSLEPGLSASGNGITPGTGVLWATHPTVAGAGDGLAHPGILRAFDASNITVELWDSNQNQARDYSGSWAKWVPPTIANGKVYLATFDSALNVFGLLSDNASGHLLGSGDSSSAAVNLTAEGDSDWEHWGTDGLNRKAGVTAQLIPYTVVGSGTVSAYSSDPRSTSWSDGTPVVSDGVDQQGIQISGVGNGFSIVAPADTVIRTLVVHVGGLNSGGSLTAHLSDGSAADFTDTTSTVSGQYDRNYTFTYGAAAAGQTLTVKWTMLSGTGNVSLSAATLGGSTIIASGGTPQSTHVTTAYATALQATVTDAGGNPIKGATVTFTAPASGASGTFGGTNTATVSTNSSGIATAPTLTANSTAGVYSVTASLGGLAGSAVFSLTNLAPLGSGSLSGSANSSSASVNLTTEGTVDWEHWGDASLNHKTGVTPVLSTYTVVGNGSPISYPNDLRPMSWSDGTPAPTANNDTAGVYIQGIGRGFSFTAPADASSRTLIVHAGGWNSGATLTAHLSDGSAVDFTDTIATASGLNDRNYTLTYSASGPGQTLTVTWAMVSGTGNVNLSASALGSASGSITASAGTPQSTTVSTAFTTALQATVKDSNGIPVNGATVTFTAPGTGPSGTFSGSTTASSNTNSSGVATAPTLTANSQAGGPYTVTATVMGVATAANYSLTNTAGTPFTITASAGTPQSAGVSSNFATALQATVKDASGNAVSGATVTFTAPGTGPSGTFSGSTTASSNTNSSGVATAPTLTANSQAGGPYTVTAMVAGVATPANYSLTNTGGSTGGSLAGSGNSAMTLVNLTSEGSTDWEHWGDASLNHKAAVTAQLSNYTVVGTKGVLNYSNDLRPISWSDGTPTASAAGDTNGLYITGLGQGFSFTAPADTTTRTLVAHLGGWKSGGTLTAHLSDGSAADFTDTTATASGQYDRNYTLTYNAGSASQTLTVTWTMISGTGNVTLNGAALGSASGSITASAGTPQSATAGSNFTTALQATVKDASGNPVSGISVTFTAPGTGPSGTFSGSTTASSNTNSSGVATAPTLTANSQAGGPYTVAAMVAGVATAANYSLTNTAGSPASITASVGTPQSATVSTNFATALQATVKDSNGNAVSGVSVTFTAPGTGPSGTFSGSATASSNTNPSGVAIAPILTANSQAGGPYTVTATVSGVATAANYSLTNTGGSTGGSLVGSGNSAMTLVSLTSEGTTDWRHWGDSSLNHKAGVAAQLSNYTVVGTQNVLAYSNDLRPISWSDGTPTASAAGDTNGLYITGLGQGFSFTAPADTTTRTLVAHLGGWKSGGTLTAHLSDGSAADFTDTTATASGQYDRNYTLTYNAGSASQTLTVTWTMISGTGNVTLNGAALGSASGSITASAGTPQSATAGSNFTTALQATVKDASGNPVSGISVTFTAPGTGPSGTFSGSTTASSNTNSSGVATAPTLTANSQAGGPYTVTAMVAGVATAANYSLTNTAGSPASITASVGTPQSATVSTNFATALQATVKDAIGNPVNGVSVTFTAPGSGSTATFSGSATASSNTNSSGVATAPTLTANSQAGGPYTVTAMVAGVATAANYSLTNTAGTPASITATLGTPQSATVGSSFATALQATVKDASGNPVSGISVTFTAPGTGPSGTFSGSTTASSNTNSSGVATTPTLTANSQAGGPYTVTAMVAGVPTPANYSLTNTGGSTGGSLVGSGNSAMTLVNLTSEGSTDWEHWGDASLNHKVGVTAQLSNYTVVGTQNVLAYSNDLRPISWSDGTPTASAASDTNGLYIQGLGQGFSFTAPADTTSRTLVVHVGGWKSGGTLTAHLSDGSAADFTDTTATASGQYDRNYTLTYSGASAGQTLTVTWKMSSGSGNVTLNAAAIQ